MVSAGLSAAKCFRRDLPKEEIFPNASEHVPNAFGTSSQCSSEVFSMGKM